MLGAKGLKQKVVVFDGSLRIVENPAIALTPGHMLVKPLTIYLGFSEKLVTSGLMPLKIPVTPGSMGIGKVVETYNDDSSITGKNIVISPFHNDEVLGVDRNGLLGNFVTLPTGYVHSTVEKPHALQALTPLVHHAYAIAEKLHDNPLILGCELLSILAGVFSRNRGFEPAFICVEDSREACKLGFKVYKNLGEIPGTVKSLVVTSYNPILTGAVIEKTHPQHIIVSPLSFTSFLRLPLKEKVLIERVTSFRVESFNEVEKGLREVRNDIRVVEVDDVEKTLGLIPPRGFGVVVKYSKLFYATPNE
ncbi:hypothetical protein IMZ38_04195 [Thermosphaera chiliense]|uniref:Uncharacterized protein n=1 Tax=Thermosphaera chiliense TaxID=3402707 RepID=A0A7M1UNL8_9CREN|nr:hypothetical protein [Thermosphaera aggregans]QOR93858.1 hypothetical protein IMZ38_04195 [Thermosphaera aggregans]